MPAACARGIRVLVIALIALASILATSGAIAAQDATQTPTIEPTTEPTAEPTIAPTDPASEQIKVAGLLCLDWSCLEFGDRLDGFTITAIDIDTRETLGSCTTDTASEWEGCLLEIPAGAHWTLTFDEAQTPEGYIYHGSIIGVEGGAHGSVTYVPFHPLADPEPGHMVVQAALCTDASCDEFERYLDGFLITAIHPETGQEYSECMTDNAQQGLDHQCILDVPVKGQVELTWVEDQVPDGYEPFGEPIVSGDPAVTTLAFVPEDAAPEPTKPVTTLPVTGSAPAADGDTRPDWAVAISIGALVVLGASLWHDLTHRRR